MVLKVHSLYSGYRQVPIIKNAQFEIKAGEIVGLIGLNGAGKSTLLKTILGLLTPMQGHISLGDITIRQDHQAYARQIAYIPETPILYDELTLKEHIEMTALGYGLSEEEAMKRAQPLLSLFRLDQHLNWFPAYFSKGMKQKVMVICALITDAKLLVIDEPFLGLDPLAIKHFADLLEQRAAQGTAIILTTHILSIADQLCDRFLFLSQGQIVAQGDKTSLQTHYHKPTATLDDLYLALVAGDANES
ncbi:ABC transporter ATP-binding protein [Vaginisenegalia massiliensis]|uniref:ABC transporter ATP-binding protein n=1 Tax=Vaginisenegalia massiliensis TaxID=2058294 RepID=UPI000F534EF3|nr:ABC transporter ATP-binding protein [Vaginisenegalia massiliensis]